LALDGRYTTPWSLRVGPETSIFIKQNSSETKNPIYTLSLWLAPECKGLSLAYSVEKLSFWQE
jgi:hypothetical protein